MLELRHLRSLAAIAQTGKLATAAHRVHLTQSALSHQIATLESDYGMALMTRSRAGVALTPAGERLVALARSVLAEVTEAERDLLRLRDEASGGELRVALECHTCFEWLMPVLDDFRDRWPQVDVDLVSGFHSEPLDLIAESRADLVIGGLRPRQGTLASFPLFRFEILAVLAPEHALRKRPFLTAADVAGETLITYPVPEDKIDFIREVLRPAGVTLARRTAELTLAILQLVASRRGIAALPNWGVKSYVDHDYVIARRIGRHGLWSELHATVPRALSAKRYVADFVAIVRERCRAELPGVELL